jgi:ABC-type lipoprotein release transport system permease subunit
MSLWKIAWRSIQQRALSSWLTGLSMALGVALVVVVLVIHSVINRSFKDAAQGYHLIVGAKGGEMQLTLNTVFHLSKPIENIPWSYYKEFLKYKDEDGNQIHGKYSLGVQLAVPYCLGDSYHDSRVVGTTPDLFDKMSYGNYKDGDEWKEKKYDFAQGENFHQDDFRAAVIGSVAANKTGLKLGDTFPITHGLADDENSHVHKEDLFHVVGILEPTGTPNDRAVFVNLEGFLLIRGHEKPVSKYDEQLVWMKSAYDQIRVATQCDGMPSEVAESVLGASDEMKNLLKALKRAERLDVPHKLVDIHRVLHQSAQAVGVSLTVEQSLRATEATLRKGIDELLFLYTVEQLVAVLDELRETANADGDALAKDAIVGIRRVITRLKSSQRLLENVESAQDELNAEVSEEDETAATKTAQVAARDVLRRVTSQQIQYLRGLKAQLESLMPGTDGQSAATHRIGSKLAHVIAIMEIEDWSAAQLPVTESSPNPAKQDRGTKPLPENQREVTAILVRMENDLQAMRLQSIIKEGTTAQAVSPIKAVNELFNGIVGPVQYILLILAALVVVVAGIGVMVSIYNSMSDRSREIAVMRALGAGRSTVMIVVLLESILLSLLGGVAGVLIGHISIGCLSPLIVNYTGISIGFFQYDLFEVVLIPSLVVLAALVGYLPALAAYRTDVARALSAAP